MWTHRAHTTKIIFDKRLSDRAAYYYKEVILLKLLRKSAKM